jgi:phosphatidate cytidylyltransferase
MLALVAALVARGPGEAPLASVSATLFGVVYPGFPMACVILLHALPGLLGWTAIRPSPWAGLMVVALPLAATWVGDAAALLAGTAWGKRKLFPTVSPNKSWVGAWAGVTSAAAAAAVWLAVARDHLPGLPIDGFGVAAGVGACLGLAAIVGDLAESLLKREAGVKDSGRIFPGHGGVMDRLDALTFTMPIAYAILVALEWAA